MYAEETKSATPDGDFAELVNVASRLEKAVDILSERIGPVLTPGQPQEMSGGIGPVPIRTPLREEVTRVDRAANRIYDLIERVAL